MFFKTHTFLRTLLPAALVAVSACGGGNPTANQAQAASVAVAKQPAKPAVVAQDVPADVANAISRTLEKNYSDQNLKVKSVSTSPIKGLYEVVVSGNQIAYTDATGDYMIVGDLIQTAEGRSLTEERKSELNAIDFNALPLDKAIKEVRGKGELKVVVFSDPDCPFCKRLEREFAKMNNITIYNFLMPIPSLHPDAHRKSVQIWCQPNRTQAWTEWMRNGKMPPKVAECTNPVTETANLGNNYGFNGTPTMVFPNGKVQSGYSPMPQLEILIKTNQK